MTREDEDKAIAAGEKLAEDIRAALAQWDRGLIEGRARGEPEPAPAYLAYAEGLRAALREYDSEDES